MKKEYKLGYKTRDHTGDKWMYEIALPVFLQARLEQLLNDGSVIQTSIKKIMKKEE